MNTIYKKGNHSAVKVNAKKYDIYKHGKRLATVACPNSKTALQSAINIVNRYAGL